jgi:purine nucleoside phosphorylase
MQVLGISAITNLALGDENQQADTIEEVLVNAAIAGKSIQRIIGSILQS